MYMRWKSWIYTVLCFHWTLAILVNDLCSSMLPFAWFNVLPHFLSLHSRSLSIPLPLFLTCFSFGFRIILSTNLLLHWTHRTIWIRMGVQCWCLFWMLYFRMHFSKRINVDTVYCGCVIWCVHVQAKTFTNAIDYPFRKSNGRTKRNETKNCTDHREWCARLGPFLCRYGLNLMRWTHTYTDTHIHVHINVIFVDPLKLLLYAHAR